LIKTRKKETEKQPEIIDSSNSKLLTAKELSQLTGLSSRKVNSWLSDNKLMYKKEDDWSTTKRGKEVGGIQKSGQYGQFVIWPEEIGKQMTE
jgi:phage antirepressor YoqD-like protein